MAAEDCILLNLRAFKICFILMDVVCVLAQLAGTALTITFGDLVSIGQKVSPLKDLVSQLLTCVAGDGRSLGTACVFPSDLRRVWSLWIQDVSLNLNGSSTAADQQFEKEIGWMERPAHQSYFDLHNYTLLRNRTFMCFNAGASIFLLPSAGSDGLDPIMLPSSRVYRRSRFEPCAQRSRFLHPRYSANVVICYRLPSGLVSQSL